MWKWLLAHVNRMLFASSTLMPIWWICHGLFGNLTKHRMFRFFRAVVPGVCRVFQVIEISYGPLLVLSLSFMRLFMCVRVCIHYMCKYIYALEYKHKKEVILLNCVRGTLYKCNICKEYARFSRHLSLPLSFSSMEFVAVWSGTDFIWFTLHANHVPNTKRTKFRTNVAVREKQSEKKTIWKFVTPLHRLTWEFFRPKFPNEI